MIRLKNISKSFQELKIIDNISLDIEKEKVTVLLGPSGCGKSTLLNIVAGVIKTFEGEIESIESSLGYVFQEDRLLPWKSVTENISFVTNGKKVEESKVDEIFNILKIHKIKDSSVRKLSGGQKQRVNIARAFIYPSKTILMDEPFRSLDLNLKMNIIRDFISLIEKYEHTVLLVTHDIREALLLADTIYILSDKPSKILKKITIPVEREQRSVFMDELNDIEKEIHKTLFSDSI